MSGATEIGRPARRHAGGRPGTVGNSIHQTTPRRLLALGDLTAILVGFVAALGTLGGASLAGTALAVVGAVMLGLAAIRMQRLWDSTVTTVRSVELAKVTRVAAVLGAGVLVADRIAGSPVRLWPGLAAAAAVWLLLMAWRSAYRSWLTLQRRNGQFTQQVLVVGTDRRTLEAVRTFEVHPEAGMRVIGLVGIAAGGPGRRLRAAVARRHGRRRRGADVHALRFRDGRLDRRCQPGAAGHAGRRDERPPGLPRARASGQSIPPASPARPSPTRR